MRRQPDSVPVTLDVSKMIGGGYALKLALSTKLTGPCMRCLKEAAPEVEVQAREVDVPGEGEELESPYVNGGDRGPGERGRATRLRWRHPRRCCAGRTAQDCARSAPPISTKPVPSTRMSVRETRGGRS